MNNLILFKILWSRPAVGKEENRLQAVFRNNATARGGAKEARLRASLDSRQPRGFPLGFSCVQGTRPLGLGQTAVFTRQTVWKLRSWVQICPRRTFSKNSGNVTLSPRRSARIDFPYGRDIRLVCILYPATSLYRGVQRVSLWCG